MDKRNIIEIVIWLILFVILISLLFHYRETNTKESFDPNTTHYQNINQKDLDKKTIDRLKLQTLINQYESNYKCCNGIHPPSNSCAFSFNTNFYPGSYNNLKCDTQER